MSDTYSAPGFAVAFAARDDVVRATLADLRARLTHLGMSPGTCGTVEIVMAEVLNNIVEHAYADSKPGAVDMAVAIGDDRLSINLRDSGIPLPDHVLHDTGLPDTTAALEDLPEGGFGWHLIRELTSALGYVRKGGQNHLHMQFDIAGPMDRARHDN